jgi:hypothetical protein
VEKEIKSTLTAQTEILFTNIDETLNAVEETQLYDEKICDWPLAEQIYHLLRSLDQYFINPNNYREAPIALKKNNTRLTKTDFLEYRDSIKTRITNYLESTEIDLLSENPPDCQFDRLTLILGQYRHLMYHIGLIHGCLRIYSGGKILLITAWDPPLNQLKGEVNCFRKNEEGERLRA